MADWRPPKRQWAALFRRNEDQSVSPRGLKGVLQGILQAGLRAAPATCSQQQQQQQNQHPEGSRSTPSDRRLPASSCASSSSSSSSHSTLAAGSATGSGHGGRDGSGCTEGSAAELPHPTSPGQDFSGTAVGLASGEAADGQPAVVLDPYVSSLASSLNVAVPKVQKPFQDMVSRLHAQLASRGVRLLGEWQHPPAEFVQVRVDPNRRRGGGGGEVGTDGNGIGGWEGSEGFSGTGEHEDEGEEEFDDAAEDEEGATDLLCDQFWKFGKISNLDHVLGMHPQYLEMFSTMVDSVLQEEGPLSLPTRYFISMMAAGSFRCEYLARDLAAKFLDAGGDALWLEGFEHVPEKLRHLAPLNALLAHQPWRVTQEMISELTRKHASSPLASAVRTSSRHHHQQGDLSDSSTGSSSASSFSSSSSSSSSSSAASGASSRPKPWLMSHLVHAVVILCQHHLAAAIVMAMGINFDADMLTVQDEVARLRRGATGKEPGCNGSSSLASQATMSGCETGDRSSDSSPTLKHFLVDRGLSEHLQTEASRSDKLEAFQIAVASAGHGHGSVTESEASDSDAGGVASVVVGTRREKSVSGSSWTSSFSSGGVGGSGGGGSSLTASFVAAAVRENATAAAEARALKKEARRKEKEQKVAMTAPAPDNIDKGERSEGKQPEEGLTATPTGALKGSTPETASVEVAAAEGGNDNDGEEEEEEEFEKDDDDNHDEVLGFCGRFVGSDPDAPLCREAMDFFKSKSSEKRKFKILRVQDFSWHDHCCAFLQRYLPNAAEPLDDQFATIYELTYLTLGHSSDVDTEPFRQAVWHYTQSLLGVRNDDYDYRIVNKVLAREMKSFIRKVVFFPYTVTADDVRACSSELLDAEKCHVVLLCTNARVQASLMYALRAIIKHVRTS